jgi:hypothetical protein
MSNATEFKTACVLQNTIEELEEALKHEEALKQNPEYDVYQLDCEVWQIIPDEWTQAVREALAEKLAEAD